MKKINSIISILGALLLTTVPHYISAQTINGNVYGGGKIAKVDGDTYVTIENGNLGADIFGGSEGALNDDGTVSMSADVSGKTHVTINGGEFAVEHIENPESEALTDFAEQYNIYGGGNIASQVGETHVYVKKGMIAKNSDGTGKFLENSNEKGIAQAYYQRGQMYFCIFGGGYGKNTSVTGDTWVDFNIEGMKDINSTAIEDDLLERQSYLDVVGGGFNGTVQGNTNVHIGGNAMCRDVYGGGLYATIGTQNDAEKGKTNVYISGGNIDNVYGGGVMGDILTSTNVTIGLHDALTFDGREYAVDNDKVTILMSVFGGNDVSGRVEQANINHYGGEVDQDIYGAGNGNYRGYYTPGVCDYADGENDNYYPVDHSGDTSTDGKGTKGPAGNTYKGRPQTGNVNITIAGNSTDDRASVLGQVFGGGNSCTIGNWVTPVTGDKHEGDPHKWRDDPEYFLGGGHLNVNLGSHVKIGRSRKELIAAGDEEYLNKEGENVSGLFMGCSGKFLATQETAEDDYVYHHYYDKYTAKYWSGFAVFDNDGEPLSREEGLKSFNAYLNNILVWSDNVTLNIDDEAEDIWLANFVGGGFRGSMKAKTAAGRFAYKLPEGVTIGNAVVGGAYNTDVVYRVYDTESDMHTYKTTTIDGKTHYLYRTDVKDDWHEGEDYHHIEYAEDGETINGIVRFYYDGGILAEEGADRIHKVHADPRTNNAEYATAYFEPMTEGDNAEDEATKAKLFTSNRDKAFVYLNLRCALEPEVLANSVKEHAVHGGNVFGGCFMSGLVQGDSWVDYGAWLSPNCTDTYYFDKSNNMHIYSEAADLVNNNALNVFGAGYGENTHTAGDTYLYIKAVAQTAGGDGNKNGKYPYMFNAFGGSYAGRVYGNTNVYYASGKQGTLLGSLYGGGFKGDIDGNTFVELAEGFVTNVYGGSRQADIYGAAHVWAYDGKSRGINDANHLIICNLYGGNDIAGEIKGTMPAKFTETKWDTAPTGETLTDKQFNSYVEISADDNSANRGFPLIGSAYAGGNGVEWEEQLGVKPEVKDALIEIDGGSTLRAFGGGNMATVTDATYIFANASSTTFADVTFSEYQKNIMQNVFFNGVTSGYTWDGTTLKMDPFHVANLFGGNNLAPMDIQPTWNLKKGRLENVYSGGNMGDMTYYNATPAEGKSKGLSITIDSDNIHIDALYGGCRMSDVKAMDGVNLASDFGEDDYGATVNIKAGYINNVYGGNDVSGTVVNGTNVNITGAVSGNVYGSGNGNYYYVWDKDATEVKEVYVEDGKNSYSYYKVPKYYGGDDANDAEKILTINHWRPSVSKAYLNISGTESNVAYVKGNVYCGGNASTVEGDNAHTKFNIGSHVTLNGVFMGSDGMEFSTTENIRRFESLNKFDMTSDVEWPASWTDKDGNECDAPVADEDKGFYPSMLSLYMKAVEMDALPQGFQASLNQNRENAYIGVFCGGGNRGSMTIDETVNMTLPSNITIYDKVVAGCLDANLTYKNGTKEVTNVGGYYRPMEESAGRTKLNYTVECQFKPLVMDVPDDIAETTKNSHNENFAAARAHGFLYDNYGKAKIRNVEYDVYNVGCNIYGGCYHSGDVLGDVVLNVKSAMLADPLSDADKRERLNNTIKAEVAAFNVYGAGFDMGSHVYGNVTITLDNTSEEGNLPAFDKLSCPSASNINGGGRSGYLYGNSYINILNGVVYNNVIGGSDAGYQYGSTHIAVGDPVMYECNTQGEYTLDRADKWNEDKVNHDGTKPVTTSMKLMVGDRVSEAVYNKITKKDNVEIDKSDAFTACYVRKDGTRLDWTNRKIHIGAGVYAGGYALATGSAVYAGDYTVRKLKEGNRWKDITTGNEITTLDGYAGNANIMIADDPANETTGTTDHITISTIVDKVVSGMKSKMGFFTRKDTQTTNALGDPIYSYDHQSDGKPDASTTYYQLTGEGGIFGDGHLSFVEGFRSADVQRYGYAEHVPQDPKLLNTLQRLDFVRIQDCCLMLQGATDFAVNANSGEVFSIARVRELYLESNIDADSKLDPGIENSDLASADRRHEEKRSRNYLGFFNNVHYIGAIATNDEFSTEKYHDETGTLVNAKTYQENKQDYITADYDETNHVIKDGEISTGVTHYDHFKKRNIGTARNMIGINNGYTLKVQNVYTTYNDQLAKIEDNMYYGPIVGVAEVKLLTLVVGEGGGYVYADNVHSDGSKYMNTSGNFVFPGTVDESNPQYVVDDCFPKNFAGTESSNEHQATEAHDDNRPAHYWYVMGNKYFFTNTITGYTYGDEDFLGEKNLYFDMDNLDQIITLSGTKKGDKVRIKNIIWEHPHDSHYTQKGQSCDIADTEHKAGYTFHLSASTEDTYNTDGGYTLLPRTDAYTGDGEYANLTYDAGKDNGQESPLLAIRLNDSQKNNTQNYWRDHLSDPCRVTFDLESGEGDPSNIYTYHITLKIVYVQGPRVTGKLHIDNCAMPGELIHAESKDLVIETDEAMPVTGTSWRLVNPDPEATVENGRKYVYIDSYNKYIDHSKADVLAKYRYNGWGLEYVVHTSGNSFPVSLDPESKFTSLLVHNYHDMQYVNKVKSSAIDALDPQAGARIYIKDKDGWDAFISYLNLATEDNTYGIPAGMEGIKVYLQSDITLDAVPAINVPFKGELNGDGYGISIPSGSLFGSKLATSAKVYNLGLVGGNSITTVENVTENCFVKETNADFLYGKKAYELSHRYHTDDAADGYINGNRFAKGEIITAAHDDEPAVYEADWQYARVNTNDDRMLRTGEPYYGSVETRHNTEHTAAEIEAHDCLFFGQALNPTGLASKPYPEHIDDSKLFGNWNEDNRVYRTTGYYQSTTADKFHYNKVAWAMQPTLTAIDFTGENVPDASPSGFYGKTDDRPTSLTSFNSDHNGTVSEYSNATTGKVTQNLLVYNSDNGNAVFKFKNLSTTTEEDVQYHNILKDGSGNYATDYMHLVDKQDFCAPLAFNVTNRAWYERKPAKYAEKGNDAWEGICLPFTVSKATASLNGEITHFYGEPSEAEKADPATNFHTLHHEYWLRGLTIVTVPDASPSGPIATFQRPGASPLFTQGTATMNYEYKNTWFKDTYGDDYNGSPVQNNWYYTDATHSYTDYKPLEANIPYIVSFPGSRFYEFDLSSSFYNEKKSASEDEQTITFSSGSTTIPVTETIQTTDNGYAHTGTFLHIDDDAVYGINEDGTAFDKNISAESTVLPFRTYMMPANQAAKHIKIGGATEIISENFEDEYEFPSEGEISTRNMLIHGKNGRIIIESNYNTNVCIFNPSGQLVRAVNVYEGTNIYTGFAKGIYIINEKKILLK